MLALLLKRFARALLYKSPSPSLSFGSMRARSEFMLLHWVTVTCSEFGRLPSSAATPRTGAIAVSSGAGTEGIGASTVSGVAAVALTGWRRVSRVSVLHGPPPRQAPSRFAPVQLRLA